MAEEQKDKAAQVSDDGSGTATVEKTDSTNATKKSPKPGKPRQLPPYKVLLHNDDVNDMLHVVMSIIKLTTLSKDEAIQKMLEAHYSGIALLLVTHKERAELYEEQFRTFRLKVTIEPDA